jgi:hypothetical protein
VDVEDLVRRQLQVLGWTVRLRQPLLDFVASVAGKTNLLGRPLGVGEAIDEAVSAEVVDETLDAVRRQIRRSRALEQVRDVGVVHAACSASQSALRKRPRSARHSLTSSGVGIGLPLLVLICRFSADLMPRITLRAAAGNRVAGQRPRVHIEGASPPGTALDDANDRRDFPPRR